MDKTNRYYVMCKKAVDLQMLKANKGYIEGDYISILKDEHGREVVVVSADYIHIRSKFHQEPEPKGFFFATLDDPERKIEIKLKMKNTEPKPEKVLMVNHKFNIRSFDRPIWLPRQDQLENFYYVRILKSRNPRKWIQDLDKFYEKYTDILSTTEQVALCMIMEKFWKLKWFAGDSEWATNEQIKMKPHAYMYSLVSTT